MPCILKKLKTYQVHRKNQIKTIVAIMTLPLSLSAGFALDNPIASASLSTLQGVNSSNADNTQEALGVEAHAVGDQSSMSGDSIGAVGKRIATMSLVMKPQCNSDTVLNGLDGAELKFPCQPISSALTGTICLPKLADCKDSKNFAPLVVPLGSNNNIYGYNFTASCQASCTIKMSQSGAVITNADSITNQSKQAAAKNDQYNMVAQGYIGKDGYSKQQAYMWSFSKGGSNDVIGTQCINGAAGYLKNGEYHTCDNKEQGAMGQGCKTQKICLDWDILHQIITTNRECTLTSGSKDIQCHKVVNVQIKTKIIPPQDIPFNGSGKTDWRSEAYHSGAHFTFPMTGKLKSFNITSHGNWAGYFWVHIPPIVSSIDVRYGSGGGFFPKPQNPISFSYSNLNIQVTQGQQGQLSADGREYAYVPDMTIDYNGVIEIPQKIEKYPVITTEIQC